MITAIVSARLKAVIELYEIGNKLHNVRSYICFDSLDVAKIDSAIMSMDDLVNKIMKVK